MKIYRFHFHTKEFIGEGVADENPLEKNKPLIPANSTTIKPPKVGKNQVAVFDGNEWQVEDDLRHKKYWLNYHDVVEITKIGENPPENATLERPAKPAEMVESERIAAIKLECRWRIVAIFPIEKQANAQARALRLVNKRAESEKLSASEVEELAMIEAASDWIDDMRAYSNQLEKNGNTDPANADWPIFSNINGGNG